MMANTLWAGLHMFQKKAATFERTPKFGAEGKKLDWTAHKYNLRLDRVIFLELIMVLWNFYTFWLAAHLDQWGIALYAGIFGTSLLLLSTVSILQAMSLRRKRI